MQGAQTWADHGKDLTRESLLDCLDDVRSETSKDGDQEEAWASASDSQHGIALLEYRIGLWPRLWWWQQGREGMVRGVVALTSPTDGWGITPM